MNEPHQYVIEPTSELREALLRTLYLLYLTVLTATITLGWFTSLTLLASLAGVEPTNLSIETTLFSGVLILLSPSIHKIWKTHLCLERIDAQFNGCSTTWAHQKHPLWSKTYDLLLRYPQATDQEKTTIRQELTYIAHNHPPLYDVIHAHSDTRLQWDLHNHKRPKRPPLNVLRGD